MERTLSVIRAGLEQGLHVGAQIYVSHRGVVTMDEGIGLARPATARPSSPKSADRAELPMTRDTLTLWLSSGKPITAAAIATLWQDGRLDLDDTVAKHIPEFATHGKEQITLRHILTHTAPLRLADTGWPHATWEQTIRRVCATRPEPRWIPGRTAGYSAHITWYLLAEVAQRLTGTPLPDLLRTCIFEPFGMADTFVSMTPDQQQAYVDRLAITQTTEKGPPTDLGTETPEALAVARPSGSVRGPARSLAKFYEALLARGAGVLSPQTVEAMTARHRVNTHDKTFGAIIDWGLGFILNSLMYGRDDTPYQYGPHASPRTFGHSGNQSSAAFADPENALVAIVIFNGLPGEPRHQPRIRATLAAIYEDLGLAPAT
jgi:CubicO group peptidase (beta-lactamase class C family)